MTDGEALLGDKAYDRLIANLREGSLAAGEFVSIPWLVELLGLPLVATREAVNPRALTPAIVSGAEAGADGPREDALLAVFRSR